MPGRELLVLRHGKSDWDSGSGADFERPLAKRGRKDAPRMGRWLREQGVVPDRVISSPATRAAETARLACRELGIDPEMIHWEPRVYEADLGDLLAVLSDCPESVERVMLVGHNPGLERLVDHLCAGIPVPDDGKLLPTATLARLRMPGDWSRLESGCGRPAAIVRPRSLHGW